MDATTLEARTGADHPDRLAWLRRRALKPLVFSLCLVPLAWIVASLVWGRLVDPVATTLNRLGFWTETLLLATLSATPARIVLGIGWPLRVRRMLGLFTFFYACLHLATYVAIDQGLDLGAIVADVAQHRFITAGMATFLLLVPLALTSTRAAVRRLGGARWRRRHRLVYVAAAGGVVHFFWRVKADESTPFVFAAVLAALLGIRVADAARRRRRTAARARPGGHTAPGATARG